MTADPRAGAVRRILVALDSSRESLAVLEQAAGLAARLEAELDALFVEDIDLFNLAGLPFAREFNLLTPTGRVLDEATLEREMKALAALARRAVEEAAQQRNLRWAFRVARGRVETELLSATGTSDIVALPRAGRSAAGPGALTRLTRIIVETAACSVLLAASAEAGQAGPVAAVFDASPAGEDTLDVAARLAAGDGRPLTVLVPGQPGEADRLEALARKRLRRSGVSLSFRRIAGTGTAELLRAVERVGAHMLVLPGETVTRKSVAPAIERAGCAVLLVGAGD